MSTAMFEPFITSLPRVAYGKVRDIYAVDDDKLLVITSDRLSAFDVVLPDAVPRKGEVLTAISQFWFDRLSHVIPNHLTGIDPESVVKPEERDMVRGRSMVVKRLTPLPIEAVVRGYLAGSAWKEYQESSSVCGIQLPPGLKLASKLPQPVFTPATKAEQGMHDENIDFETARQHCERYMGFDLMGTGLHGADFCEQAREVALTLYTEAAEYALSRGILIADTKFEFGVDKAGTLYWIDEAITPDSSRFWPADSYCEGRNPPSFDKQYVRDYLESLNWNKKYPGPRLSLEVLENTTDKYVEAAKRLMA